MNMKKILALVVAVMMLLSMCAAFAADPTNGTITITNSADGKVIASERTFTAYRILNATEVFGDGEDKPATGIAYTIPNAAAVTALATKFLTDDDATTVNEKEKGENETDPILTSVFRYSLNAFSPSRHRRFCTGGNRSDM